MTGWICFAVVLMVAGGIELWRVRQERSRLRRISALLDAAIAGRSIANTYDESVLSSLEQKLARFLSANQLAEKRLEIEQAQVRTLIADISHQTKTPISNLLLYTELLQEQLSGAEGQETLAQIETQAQKLQFLIDALVKMSRLENGILTMHARLSPMEPLLEAVVQQFTPRAEEKQLTLSWEKTSLCAVFDPKWMMEAVGNLVDNALKYTPAGGSISLRVEPLEMFCRLDVTDTGVGIPETEHANIFTRFYRAPSVAEVEGVGIGLYLTREIVSACGGYVRVRSRMGEGSCFSIFLPKEVEKDTHG